MQNKQRYVTAGLTIAAAAATAHLMQQDSGSGPPQQVGPATAAVAAPIPGVTAVAPSRVQNEVTVVAAQPTEEIVPDVAPAVVEVEPVVEAEPEFETAALDLEIELEPDVEPMEATTEPRVVDDAPATERLAAIVPEADPALGEGEAMSIFPTPPTDVLMPKPLPRVGTTLAERVTEVPAPDTSVLTEQSERSRFGLSCGPILSGTQITDGLVNLTLAAPCRADERIEVSHGPLKFTAVTDSLGTYQMTVPALTPVSEFNVAFADGETAQTMVDVTGIAALDRVAVVATQGSGLQIHALEFGADYGEPGHIWAENPGNPALAAMDGTGYLVQLGDATVPDATLTEVYTFPRDQSGESGVVRLSLEAEVSADNCATEVVGESVEPGPENAMIVRTVTVAMPDCDAIGEYLVLKNLLRDLRIASK